MAKILRPPLPDFISFAAVDAEDEAAADTCGESSVTLPPSFVPLRRRTFALGRLAASRAMSRLGCVTVAVPRNEDGSPAWPSGLVGSISHTSDIAVAVVAHRKDARGLGVDVEEVRRAQFDRIMDIQPLVADRTECGWIEGDPVRLLTLFSAKEAIYKAFYPGSGPLGFEHVHLEPTFGGFIASLRVKLNDYPCGYKTKVSSAIDGEHILSAVWLPHGHVSD